MTLGPDVVLQNKLQTNAIWLLDHGISHIEHMALHARIKRMCVCVCVCVCVCLMNLPSLNSKASLLSTT